MTDQATCGCNYANGVWLMCQPHYTDLAAELASKPSVIPALLAAIEKWKTA